MIEIPKIIITARPQDSGETIIEVTLPTVITDFLVAATTYLNKRNVVVIR